jgi:aldose 1-epimerase
MPFEASIHKSSECPVITLRDCDTGCEAEIYTLGGLLNAFRVAVQGSSINVVEGFSSIADAKKNITQGFKSAKLSPFVCRMRSGRYLFDGKTYQVHKHYLAGHAIHGLIYDALYNVVQTEGSDTGAVVTLAYSYDGSDEGYPFPFTVSIKWILKKGDAGGNILAVSTTVTHQHIHPIPFADGWHPYFTLGGKTDDWMLQFNSHVQLEYDDDLLPTGKRITNAQFAQGSSLQDVMLDNSFEFDTAERSRCVLSNDRLQLIIEPSPEYPILQVYIPPGRESIAIENLSGAPDNFNNGIGLLMLGPDQPKTFTTTYTVEVL